MELPINEMQRRACDSGAMVSTIMRVLSGCWRVMGGCHRFVEVPFNNGENGICLPVITLIAKQV